MKTLIKWLLIVWVALISLMAAEPVKMPQLSKPEQIAIGNGILYVLEGTTIHMYDMKKYTYLGKFGKEGEGPQEIKKNPYGGPILMVPHQGKVYVTSMAKLSIFSKTGEFISEHKVDLADSFYPFADSFVCLSAYNGTETNGKTYMTVFIADKDLKKGKILYVSDFEVGMNFKFEFPFNRFYPNMTDDRVFVIAGKEGFVIDVFDKLGNKAYRIEKQEPVISVPGNYQEETEKAFKKSAQFSGAWEFFKERISYRKNFPAIVDFAVDGQEIYVMTSKIKGDGERECIVLDLKGKEKRRLYLPIPEQYGLEFTNVYLFRDGVFYHMLEDEDYENWELHTRSLK